MQLHEDSKKFEYRYFIYILIFCHLIVNHSFNKICIILDSFFDQKMNLPIGTNVKTLASSTFLSAIGKLLGVFMHGSKKKIIIWTFLFNGLCLALCVSSNNFYLFVFARSFQGFFAGIQSSILFGLLGRHNRPFYHILVVDQRSKRDGKFIEKIGYYDPIKKTQNRSEKVTLDKERYKHWINIGAQPTEVVSKLASLI